MKITNPEHIKNWLYYFVGAGMLILNCLKNRIFGYKTPRPFSIKQTKLAIDYDFEVADEWMKHLFNYSKQRDFLKGKVVLELGPGPDLGIGLIMLAAGVRKYIAFDVYGLARHTPLKFYNKLFSLIKYKYKDCNIEFLEEQISKCYRDEDAALSYIVDKDFNISSINSTIDIIFSQASFEHFRDVERVLKELNCVVKKGSILVTEIDLKTHSRWIRDIDPLNIYRYGNLFWDLFRFKGSPNRIRAFEYTRLLKENGWLDTQIVAKDILESKYLNSIKPSLNKIFRKMDSSEMAILSFILMAKKDS